MNYRLLGVAREQSETFSIWVRSTDKQEPFSDSTYGLGYSPLFDAFSNALILSKVSVDITEIKREFGHVKTKTPAIMPYSAYVVFGASIERTYGLPSGGLVTGILISEYLNRPALY